MNTVGRAKFAVKPLVAAVALAVSSVTAFAAPTVNQMPGAGRVDALTAGANVQAINYSVVPGPFGAVGSTITNATTNNAVIGLGGGANSRAVINWGVSGTTEVNNPLGFNMGKNSTLTFTALSAGGAILNVDTSGTPSELYGTLVSGPGGAWTFAPQIYVANANGITVGPTGVIVAPSGVGLIGSNLSTASAMADFVRANTPGTSYVDAGGVTGFIVNNGFINGDSVLNLPAPFIIIAGNNITNTGNIFGEKITIAGGVVPSLLTTDTIGGVAGTQVRRLINTDVPTVLPSPFSAGWQPVSLGSNATIINTGSISAPFVGGNTGFIQIEAAGNVRSGTLGSGDTTVGLFADDRVFIDNYRNDGKVELYNVVSGYTTGVTMKSLQINVLDPAGTEGDVFINALTLGSAKSSIVTTEDVRMYGNNVHIDSTINSAVGLVNTGNPGLFVIGRNSISITKDVGADQDVFIESEGAGGLNISGNVTADTDQGGNGAILINNTGAGAPTNISGKLTSFSTGTGAGRGIHVDVDGPMTISGAVTALNSAVTNGSDVSILNRSSSNTVISGNVTAWDDISINADLDISGNIRSFAGSISIINPGVGASTNISGTLTAGVNVGVGVQGVLNMSNTVTATKDVNIFNVGAGGGTLTTISGNVNAGGFLTILNEPLIIGNLNISGTLTAGKDALVVSFGNLQLAKVNANDIDIEVGGLNSKLSGAMTAGSEFFYAAPFATTKVLPAAVITAPEVDLGGAPLQGKFFNGLLNFVGVNASGNTYLNAGEKPAFQIVTNFLDVHIQGTINAPIVGNTFWLTNSMVVKPQNALAPVFTSIWADGGAFQAINLKFLGDAVVDSWDTITPFIDVPLSTGTTGGGGLQGNNGSSMILNATGALIIAPGSDGVFQFPGGLSFNAGTLLEIPTPVYNAFTTNAVPFQGVWGYVGTGGVINATSYFATNGNAWVNFNQRPTTAPPNGGPTVYRIFGVGSPVPTLFGFVDETAAALHQNSYPFAISGFPVNTCPISVCNWTLVPPPGSGIPSWYWPTPL